MSQRLFDRKFGSGFLAAVPDAPGVYAFFDDDRVVLYVGKAVSLKGRLQQYRRSGRNKRERKMRAIVQAASGVQLYECADETAALLLEDRLIKEQRPQLNVEGAFWFLYPCLGLRLDAVAFELLYSTSPDDCREFELFGSYRSRGLAKEAFGALSELCGFLGHRERVQAVRPPYSALRRYRRFPMELMPALRELLLGNSDDFLEQIILALLDRSAACQQAEVVQASIDSLLRFYRREAQPLKRARCHAERPEGFVQQEQRDALMIALRRGTKPKSRLPHRASAC